MALKKIFIIHGFMATPHDHWFDWLVDEMKPLGVETCVPEMPNSNNPDFAVWQSVLHEQLDHLDENTILIGHSLGCITLLKYLQTCRPSALGGLVMIAGFAEAFAGMSELFVEFIDGNLDVNYLSQLTTKCAVVASPQDSIVPFTTTQKLATDLESQFYSIDYAGHFLASDGYDAFPELYDILKQTVLR